MQMITAKWVYPMNAPAIAGGAVVLEGDEIVDVGTEYDMQRRYPHTDRMDYPQHVILPGLINCHTHLDISNYKNYPGDPVRKMGGGIINYVDWLVDSFRYKRKATPATYQTAVEMGIDECLQSGTTCIADMGNYEGIFASLEQKNMRGVVFPEVVSIDSQISKNLFETAMALVEKYQDLESDLVNVGMGPHSPYTLSRNVLRILSQYCRSSQLPLMIHAAATFQEMEFFHNSTGDIADKLFPNIGWDELPPPHHRTPIQHLLQIGFLDCQPLLVGCTQTTEDDLNVIAQTGSKIVVTARAGHYLQQGFPDLKKINERHILTVLGTDGLPSVDSLSLWDEMRFFYENYRSKVSLSGQQILAMVTSNAATALGLQNEVGTLEKGKKADLIAVDVTMVSEQGDLLLNMVQQVRDGNVALVMVNGRVMKSLC